jgi:hypothetical protein
MDKNHNNLVYVAALLYASIIGFSFLFVTLFLPLFKV